MKRREAPRWTIAFLRALERSGEVEAAARDAGIDKTTAYNRRKSYPDFADAWKQALASHKAGAEAEVQERVEHWEGVRDALSADPERAPAAELRKELHASSARGGQLKRSGPGRWSDLRERRFFDELAATANVKHAAEAAGVSKNAVYARRMKRPDFRAKWDAVLETARAAIEMHLVETAKKSFDSDAIDVESADPKVSVAEAIRIVQLHGAKSQRDALPHPADQMSETDVAELRERLVRKLERLRERFVDEEIEAGWSYDEEHQQLVPPGWVKPE